MKDNDHRNFVALALLPFEPAVRFQVAFDRRVGAKDLRGYSALLRAVGVTRFGL